MPVERTEAISYQRTLIEYYQLAQYSIFSFCSNGNRALVSVVPETETTTLADWVRDEFYSRSPDVPISYSPINWPAVDDRYWLLKAGTGIIHLSEPEKNSHDSEALYTARGKFKEGTLLVQIARQWSRTSHHFHEEGGLEVYSGDGNLLIWEEEKRVKPVEKLKFTRIEPRVPHIGFTLNKPAITFIFNFGEEIRHIPMSDRPSLEFLIEKAKEAGLVSDGAYEEYKKLKSVV